MPLYRPHGQFAERVVIVGAGPGGLSAAVYAARAGLAPVVIAPSDGGQLLGKGVTVENYPGIVQRPCPRSRVVVTRGGSRASMARRRRHSVSALDARRADAAVAADRRHGPRPRPQDAGPRGGLRRGVLPAQSAQHRLESEALPRGNARGQHLSTFIDSGDGRGQ